MSKKTFKAWGWVEPNGRIQDKVFGSPDAAITEMQKRPGGPEFDIERIADVGFRLARVEVCLTLITARSVAPTNAEVKP